MEDDLLAAGYQRRSESWNDYITFLMDDVWWRYDQKGEASFAWNTKTKHLNAAKVLHGGAMASFLDHCMGALAYLDNSDSFAHTMQMGIQFISPVRANRWVFAKAKHLAGNQHNLILEVEARLGREDGNVIAKAQATFVNPLKRKPSLR